MQYEKRYSTKRGTVRKLIQYKKRHSACKRRRAYAAGSAAPLWVTSSRIPARVIQYWPLCSANNTRQPQQHRHQIQRQPALWLIPSVPSDFTGTIAGNRPYSTGTTKRSLLCIPGVLKGSSSQRHLAFLREVQQRPTDTSRPRSSVSQPVVNISCAGSV